MKFASLAMKDLSYKLSFYYVLVCKSNLGLSVFLVAPFFNIASVKMCLVGEGVLAFLVFFIHVSVILLFCPKLYILSFSFLNECSFKFFFVLFFDIIENSLVLLRPFLLGNTLLTFVLVRSKNCHFVTDIIGLLLIIEDTLNEEYNDKKVITG